MPKVSLIAAAFRLTLIAASVTHPASVQAQDSDGHDVKQAEDHYPHHHLALFAGAATETKRDVDIKTQFATGLEYELRLSKLLGIGALVEFVGDELIREVIVLVPVSFHFYRDFRLIGAPGIEFTETKEVPLFRVGLGYELHIGKGFTLTPEYSADFIEGGKITYVYGLALGKEL